MNKNQVRRHVVKRINNMLRFFQSKKTIFFSLTSILILLFVGILVRQKQPQEITQPPIISTQVDQPQEITQISFEENIPPLPQTMGVIRLNQTPTTPIQLAQKVAEKFQMSPAQEDYLENVWINREQKSSLSITSKGVVVYLADADVKNTQRQLESELIKKAENFLSSVISTNGVELDKNRSHYTTKSGESVVGVGGDIFIIPFTLKMESYPLYYNESLSDFATVYVDVYSNVIKAEFMTPPPTIQNTTQKQTLSLEEIKENVLRGKGIFVSSFFTRENMSISQIQKLHITNISPQYRYTSESPIISPYFFIQADGKDVRGEKITTHILLPATR